MQCDIRHTNPTHREIGKHSSARSKHVHRIAFSEFKGQYNSQRDVCPGRRRRGAGPGYQNQPMDGLKNHDTGPNQPEVRARAGC